MDFRCPECDRSHEIEPANIPDQGTAIECVECSNRFRIEPPENEGPDSEADGGGFDPATDREITLETDEPFDVSDGAEDGDETETAGSEGDRVEQSESGFEGAGVVDPSELNIGDGQGDSDEWIEDEDSSDEQQEWKDGDWSDSDDIQVTDGEDPDWELEDNKNSAESFGAGADSEDASIDVPAEDKAQKESHSETDAEDELPDEEESESNERQKRHVDVTAMATEYDPSEYDDEEGEQDRQDDDFNQQFFPQSPGIPDQKLEETSSETPWYEKRVVQIGILVGFLAVVGIGYFVYAGLGSNSGKQQTPIDKLETDFIRLDTLKDDNYSTYMSLVKKASRKRLGLGDRHRFLAGASLFLSQYESEKATKQLRKIDRSLKKFDVDPDNVDTSLLEFARVSSDLFVDDSPIKKVSSKLEKFTDKKGLAGFFSSFILGVRYKKSAIRTDSGHNSKEGNAESNGKNRAQKLKKAEEYVRRAVKRRPEWPGPHFQLADIYRLMGKDSVDASLKKALDKTPGHVRSVLLRARQLYEAGKVKKALAHLEEVTSQFAQSGSSLEKADIWHLYARSNLHMNRLKEAREAINKAVGFSVDVQYVTTVAEVFARGNQPNSGLQLLDRIEQSIGKKQAEPHMTSARIDLLLVDDAWEKAQKLVDKVRKKEKDNKGRIAYLETRIAVDKRAYDEAVEPAKRAIAQNPGHIPGYVLMSKIAEKVALDALQDPETYLKTARNKVTDETPADALEKLADGYRNLGRHEKAKKWYMRSLQKDKKRWPPKLKLVSTLIRLDQLQNAKDRVISYRKMGVQDVRIALNLAKIYRRMDKLSKALKQIDKVLEAESENPAFVFEKGKILYAQNKYQGALRRFQKAYRLDPSRSDFREHLGKAAMKAGLTSKAISTFESLIESNPDGRARYYYWIGRAYQDNGERSRALSAFQEAVKASDDIAKSRPKLLVTRGKLYLSLGYVDKAKKDFKRALEIDKSLIESYRGLGDAYREQDHLDQALQMYQQFIDRSDSGNAEVYYKMGRINAIQKQNADSVRYFEKAIEAGHSDPAVHKKLGYLYKSLGNRVKARKAFKDFLSEADDNDLSNSTQKEIVRQIKNLGGRLD